MPQAPQSYQQFPQGYPTTPPQNYPQQFPQQFPQDYTQAPAQPLPQGNLSDFFGQPSVSGGPSWSFKDKPVGQSYAGIVERALTNADIEPQTIPGTNRPATYRDGRQKWVMKVPMLVQADTDHPDGKATWYVSGQSRDELVRAMAEAGAPEGAPEPGAFIGVQLVGRKPSKTPGFSPSNQVRVVYRRPEGAAAPTATPVAEQPAQPAPPAQQPPDACHPFIARARPYCQPSAFCISAHGAEFINTKRLPLISQSFLAVKDWAR